MSARSKQVDPDAFRKLTHRVWRHRRTNEVRASVWVEHGIQFFVPETNRLFVVPFRAGQKWCDGAEDITSGTMAASVANASQARAAQDGAS